MWPFQEARRKGSNTYFQGLDVVPRIIVDDFCLVQVHFLDLQAARRPSCSKREGADREETWSNGCLAVEEKARRNQGTSSSAHPAGTAGKRVPGAR